jgi:hypothetical protein
MPRLKSAFALAAGGLLACAKPLDDAECDQLLTHYTERLLREEQPEISHTDLREKQERARALARETPRYEFERCAELVSRTEFECAMTAVNVDGIERCLL